MVDQTDTKRPALTVVVVVVEGTERLWQCLEALDQQVKLPEVQVIVPWDPRWGQPGDFQSDFGDIEFPFVEDGSTPAELRALGVKQARGKIVALTEDHCTPAANWCIKIIQAHAELRHAAIGGAVEKETPDQTINWAFFFADYLRYMNPVSEGPSKSLTDVNVSYKKCALEVISSIWRPEFHEPSVHSALRERGEILWLSPDIVVRQKRNFSWWSAIQDRYIFGRLFASTRVSEASRFERVWRVATSSLIVPLLLTRVTGHVFRKRRCRQQFLRSLPALVVISSLWAVGECIGYVTGKPSAPHISASKKLFPGGREAVA